MNKQLLVTTLRNVALAGIYVFGISQFLFYAGTIFDSPGGENIGVFVMLMLLCLSAAVVGSLVFGQAIMLFLENKKSEGALAAIYSVSWLFILTLVTIVTLYLFK